MGQPESNSPPDDEAVAGLAAEPLSKIMKIQRLILQGESISPPDDEAVADVAGLAAESLSRRMNS